jgi:hypothetical protein
MDQLNLVHCQILWQAQQVANVVNVYNKMVDRQVQVCKRVNERLKTGVLDLKGVLLKLD